MKKKPFVSVIMNCYNEQPATFLRAVDSYLYQREVKVQLIVSTVQGDPCIKLCKDLPVTLVINERADIWHQLNNAYKVVEGDWVTFGSANDIAIKNKLIKEVNMCLKTGKKVCYSDYYLYYPQTQRKRLVTFFPYSYKRHLQSSFVSDCSLFARELLDKYGPLKEEFINSAFHDFWLRIYEGEGNVFCHYPIPTWIYYQRQSSRHIAKRKNPEIIQKEREARKKMIELHLKTFKDEEHRVLQRVQEE